LETPGVVEELFHLYEDQGYGEQLTDLVEASFGSEYQNTGISTDTSLFTELALLYVKYRPEPLMEHLKAYWKRINIPNVIRVCEEARLWVELLFLYEHNDEYDVAATIMMKQFPDAWEHSAFKQLIVEALGPETFY